jgi:hypothetical protein
MIGDLSVVFLIIVAFVGGGMIGYSLTPNRVEYIYVEDDGEGGLRPAPRFDPDLPQPGDSVYPPDEWLVNA